MSKPYSFDVLQEKSDRENIRLDRIYKMAKETIDQQIKLICPTKPLLSTRATHDIKNAIDNIAHKFGYKYSNKLLKESGLMDMGWKLHHPIKDLEEM